jgi:hypothetical protein
MQARSSTTFWPELEFSRTSRDLQVHCIKDQCSHAALRSWPSIPTQASCSSELTYTAAHCRIRSPGSVLHRHLPSPSWHYASKRSFSSTGGSDGSGGSGKSSKPESSTAASTATVSDEDVEEDEYWEDDEEEEADFDSKDKDIIELSPDAGVPAPSLREAPIARI